MGKKKMAMKEYKALRKSLDMIEYEWAKKRNKSYPLYPVEYLQFKRESHIQQRFWELKDILIKEKDKRKSAKSNAAINNAVPKPWPLWNYVNVIDNKNVRHLLMAETTMYKAVSDIDAAFYGVNCANEGFTILNLMAKSQNVGDKDGGEAYGFERAAISISLLRNKPMYLYVGNNDKIAANLHAGWFMKNDGEEPRLIGFLIVADKDRPDHGVVLEEFNTLVEVEEDKKYLFTFFDRIDNISCTLTLTELDDIEFLCEGDTIEAIKKEKPQSVYAGNEEADNHSYGSLETV